jgi:hypothetical protein
MSRGNAGVNKVCNGLGLCKILDLFLEKDEVRKILLAKHIAQQIQPKFLTFAFLVAFAGPLIDKFFLLLPAARLPSSTSPNLRFCQIYNFKMAQSVKSFS